MTRGFVTVATGKKHYYEIARNLLLSYRMFAKEKLPFAIFCDEQNEITDLFDDTIVYENASCSFLDKINLMNCLPYDETIFVDADCLVYRDLNFLFDLFAQADDVSCPGTVLGLDSDGGWFQYDNLPQDYLEKTHYVLCLHGGVYYFRRTEVLQKVFRSSLEILKRYNDFSFSLFTKPADEPIIALSMAINGCKTVPNESFPLVCYWREPVLLNIGKGIAKDKDGKCCSIVHFATRNTYKARYKKEAETVILRSENATMIRYLPVYVKYTFGCLTEWVCKVSSRFMNLIKR